MILVTGATGFIGHTLCAALMRHGHAVRLALHAPQKNRLPAHTEAIVVGDLHANIDWSAALAGVTCVIHLAARAHVLREYLADPIVEYRRVNVEGSTRLATQAAQAGVTRFVFLSSIGVNGAETFGAPFTETTPPAPHSAYAQSKYEAELALREIAAHTGMEITIVRAPLVYGAGVKGNFLTLLDAVARGTPFPLASVRNQRSLLNVENLADALIACATHQAAANQTYLVADDEGIATPALIRAVGDALGKPAHLFPFPTTLLKIAGVLSGRTATIQRLTASLQVDSSKIRRELGWQPRITLTQGLADTARWYHARNSNPPAK